MRSIYIILITLFLNALPAWADGEAAKGPSFLDTVIPFAVMFFIFYFLMMRPQMKKQKTHQDFLQSLKKGDRVLTSSGIFGTIEGLTEKYVKLEIADDVSIRVLKAHVSQPVKEG